jgi:hypothetical protein
MATEDDLFASNDGAPSQAPIFEDDGGERPIVVDPNKDYLSEYVGEGKKFKTPAELAKAKAHSDAFIERLQREQAALRTELNTRVKLEELMDRMSTGKNTNGNVSSQPTQTDGDNGHEGTATKNFSPEDIEKVVEQRLAKREQEARVNNNVQMVKDRLKQAYGDNYVAELDNRISELGVSREFAADIAKREPKALFALLGIEGQGRPQNQQNNDLFNTPPRASVNTASFGIKDTEKKFADFEKIRKEDPSRYWSAAVQNELHKQASKLGERFYS